MFGKLASEAETGRYVVWNERYIGCIYTTASNMTILQPKTLMISTLARALNLSFSRIQFTPDLMPADITGTEIIEENRTTGSREFRSQEGPLFSNVILADEANRTPPKTQGAVVGLATQNPIEQEGTYPLPEVQQDRFMFKVYVNYPNFDEELETARRAPATQVDNASAVQG